MFTIVNQEENVQAVLDSAMCFYWVETRAHARSILLAVQEKTSPENWRRYYTQALLGATLAAQGKDSEAGPLLRLGYDGMVQRQNSMPYEDRAVVEKVHDWLFHFSG